MRLVLKKKQIPPHLLRFFKNIGHKPKDLINTPYYLAEAMREDGWYIRSPICWAKKSAMPESTRDRPTSAWEPIWMFAKSARYFWDGDAVRQPASASTLGRWGDTAHIKRRPDGTPNWVPMAGEQTCGTPESGANLRNVWTLSPEPSRENHFAAFVSEIPRRCIKAATSERGQCPACGAPWVRVVERERSADTGRLKPSAVIRSSLGIHQGGMTGLDQPGWRKAPQRTSVTLGWQPSCTCDAGDPVPQTVLDPFAGTFTTCLVAEQLGRNSIGIDLSPDYCEIGRSRIANDAPLLTADAVTVTTPDQLDLFAEVSA